MKKIFSTIIVITICSVIFTGCGYFNMGVDGLLSSPKLSREQADIHQALIESVGDNISLKYPNTGDNRSAFVISNLDDEPTNEAIVFYQNINPSTNENSIRINLLDNINGNWKSTFDISEPAIDVDKVIISKIEQENKVNIIVGFDMPNKSEKMMQIYNYGNGVINRIYSDSYSVFETMDIDMDKNMELISVLSSKNEGMSVAKLYNWSSGSIIVQSTALMDDDTASYSSFAKGMIDATTPALFIDGLKSDGTLQTDVLIFDGVNLINLTSVTEDNDKLKRMPGYYSTDVNNDGIIEIPVTKLFLGYQKETEQLKKLYMTDWYNIDIDGNLQNSFSSYYSLTDSYIFVLPKRLAEFVTIKEDTATDEIIFYKYEGEINESMEELLRIVCCLRSETEDKIQNGYLLIQSKGQIDYLAKLSSDKTESLAFTLAEVTNNLYVK